jgi:hypothetical protein
MQAITPKAATRTGEGESRVNGVHEVTMRELDVSQEMEKDGALRSKVRLAQNKQKVTLELCPNCGVAQGFPPLAPSQFPLPVRTALGPLTDAAEKEPINSCLLITYTIFEAITIETSRTNCPGFSGQQISHVTDHSSKVTEDRQG